METSESGYDFYFLPLSFTNPVPSSFYFDIFQTYRKIAKKLNIQFSFLYPPAVNILLHLLSVSHELYLWVTVNY